MDARWLWLIGIAVAAAVLVGVVAWRFVRARGEVARGLGDRIARLPWRRKGRLAWALLRDGRVPLWVRAMVPLLILYLAMPLDVIPDFIPILGYLDDIIVVLLAAGVLVRFAPRRVLEEQVAALEVEREE